MIKSITVLALAALTLGAFAQHSGKQAKPQKAKVMHCAVEGGKVDVAKATKNHMYADYKGRRYFFCCDGCPQAFAKDPAKYAKKADSIPTPKTKATK